MPASTKKTSPASSKITRTLKHISKSCKTFSKKLWSLCDHNRIATLHTVLLVWLVIRVENLHSYLKLAASIMYFSATVLRGEILDAREEFQHAIETILTLFGGNDA